MKWNVFERRTRVDIVRAILLVGLASAVGVYFTAAGPAPDPLGDPLDNSKIYQRSLEMYGGTANLLASQFMDWFKSLWHGKPLAFTLAVITLALAGGFYFFTSGPAPRDQGD